MTQTLPQVGHQHHAHILEMTNRFPEIADALLVDHGRGATAELQRVREFLQGTLVPHLEAAEATIYPELERMLQNRHSMTPMRRITSFGDSSRGIPGLSSRRAARP